MQFGIGMAGPITSGCHLDLYNSPSPYNIASIIISVEINMELESDVW